jgi:hypothetical protein
MSKGLFHQLLATAWVLAALALPAASNAATIRAVANNNFVSASAAGTSFLTATAPVADAWEQFEVINNANGTISLLGLGIHPDQVRINGELRSNAFLSGGNATQNFWRGAENFSVNPNLNGGVIQWAVSQAVPFRRMHVVGNMKLNQNNGWSSGGWFSDVLVDGQVNSASQQQWISRNTQWGSWTGSNWNMVFVGVPNPPAGNFPAAGARYTKIAQTPIVREKPYLFVDTAGNFAVRLPSLRVGEWQ